MTSGAPLAQAIHSSGGSPRAPGASMLYHLFVPLEKLLSGFRLFRYVSFRAAFAAILAFLVWLLFRKAGTKRG